MKLTNQLNNVEYSGREDVDVRMLGRGRPFTFEVTNPRRTAFPAAEMAALTDRINASTGRRVRVRDLQVWSKSCALGCGTPPWVPDGYSKVFRL